MSRRFQNILLLNASATGAGTAIVGDDRDTSTAIFAVTIAGTATITFQGSADGGVTTYSIPVTSVTASPTTSTTVTASGIYRCDATGISVFPNVTTYTSGSVTVVGSLERGTLSGGVASGGGGGGGGAVTIAASAVASGAYVSGSIADGAMVTVGTQADGAITSASTTGTLMAFMKGAVKILSDVWNNTLHYFYVAVTDGTHTMPTMDAAARAGYVTVTNGTQNMPTMDAITRSGFQKINDGTTVVGVDASTTGLKVAVVADSTAAPTTPLQVSSWDQTLTNQQTVLPASTAALATHLPAVVALHPSSPAKIFDGTNTVAVKAASTDATSSDPALVVIQRSGSKTVTQVTVTSSATSILASNTNRKSATITNQGSATIYLGSSSSVTTSNGFALAAGATMSDFTSTDAWYGIVSSTSMVAGAIEVA